MDSLSLLTQVVKLQVCQLITGGIQDSDAETSLLMYRMFLLLQNTYVTDISIFNSKLIKCMGFDQSQFNQLSEPIKANSAS